MEKGKIKIGLCGTGHLGKIHLRNLLKLEEAEFTGFYEIDPETTRRVKSEFSVKPFPSLGALIEESDAICVVVPTIEHFNVARAALESGVHVFVEKPFTSTLQEAEELIDLAEKGNLTLQVGHIERYNPALQSLRNMNLHPLFIESHRISPFPGRGTDVAVILDLMIHDIDIVLTLIKEPIRDIHASGVPVLSPNIDIANARIIFDNGAVANITASRISTRSMRKLRIFQPNAYISIDFLNNVTEIYRITSRIDPLAEGEKRLQTLSENSGSPEIRYRIIESQSDNPLRNELKAFIHSIKTGQSPPVTGRDGMRALSVALKIEQQINSSLKSFPQSLTKLSAYGKT